MSVWVLLCEKMDPVHTGDIFSYASVEQVTNRWTTRRLHNSDFTIIRVLATRCCKHKDNGYKQNGEILAHVHLRRQLRQIMLLMILGSLCLRAWGVNLYVLIKNGKKKWRSEEMMRSWPLKWMWGFFQFFIPRVRQILTNRVNLPILYLAEEQRLSNRHSGKAAASWTQSD